MKKILPSEQLSKEIASLLEKGLDGEQDLLSRCVHLSVRKLIQEVLEPEIVDY